MIPRRYVLAGGGTSGHINPALAIADQLRRDDPTAEIRFCGTQRGLESELVPRAGYPFVPIQARGLPHRLNREFFLAIRDFFRGRAQCRALLRAFRPDAVIGTGGYVCSPLVAAAASLKIPVLLHEQNAFPGRSNRLLAARSQIVCISMPGTERYFRTRAPIILTGNPVRPVFFDLDQATARTRLGLSSSDRMVLVTGGSLGARRLNEAVLGLAHEAEFAALRQQKPLQIHLACGQQHADTLTVAANGLDWLSVHAYLHDLPDYMAAADVVVARAGAMTCAELAALGKPAVLVPYPYAAGDHQTANAKIHEQAGAALLIPDHAITAHSLAAALSRLFANPGQLDVMSVQAKSLSLPDAAAKICRSLYAALST